jgi:uncharacterized radical SAM superfamily Fe-S cluster-containing enzyme
MVRMVMPREILMTSGNPTIRTDLANNLAKLARSQAWQNVSGGLSC